MKDFRPTTLIEWVSWGNRMLHEAGIENSRQEAEMLLSFCMETPFKLLLTRFNEEVPVLNGNCYQKLVLKRRDHYPLQYLTGTQEFMSLEFQVNEGVLIPRWDTERLVETALEILKKWDQPWVLDVGTGSGAIVVSLAKYHPRGHFFAVDISPEALAVAHKNACRHGVDDRITFLSGNMLDPILNSLDLKGRKFDLIVSNPPYIPRGDIEKLPEDVQKEPHLALDGGQDGLTCYRDLLAQAPKVLNEEGYVLLEIGSDQAKDVEEICRANSFQDISVFQDYGLRDRVLVARFGEKLKG